MSTNILTSAPIGRTSLLRPLEHYLLTMKQLHITSRCLRHTSSASTTRCQVKSPEDCGSIVVKVPQRLQAPSRRRHAVQPRVVLTKVGAIFDHKEHGNHCCTRCTFRSARLHLPGFHSPHSCAVVLQLNTSSLYGYGHHIEANIHQANAHAKTRNNANTTSSIFRLTQIVVDA